MQTIFGVDTVGKVVKDIVGTFKLSPAARLEFERELAAHEHELKIKSLELETNLQEAQTREVEAASANIRAEAATGDKYTVRARPTFLYIVYVILVNNYVVAPYLGRNPVEFPEAAFWLFGSVMLGYMGGRSWEKVTKLRNGNH